MVGRGGSCGCGVLFGVGMSGGVLVEVVGVVVVGADVVVGGRQ